MKHSLNDVMWRRVLAAIASFAISTLAGCTLPQTSQSFKEDTMPVDVSQSSDDFTLNLFHAIVKQRVRQSFAALSRQDAEPALALMDEAVTYTFDTPGSRHALAGTRHSKQAVQRWFTRLFALLPGQFEVRRVDVTGWPWRASVVVHFEDRVAPRFGAPYVNHGMQEVELHWGTAVRIHTHVETVKVERALAVLAQHGVVEASAAPIED